MSDEEAFDLFSTSMVKVKPEKAEVKEAADQIQLAAARKMGDVPPEQLPERSKSLYDYLFAVQLKLISFDKSSAFSTYYYEPPAQLSPKEKRKANWMNLNAKGKPWMNRR